MIAEDFCRVRTTLASRSPSGSIATSMWSEHVRAHGKKTGEGAAAATAGAVCTWKNSRKSANNRAKTNTIRPFNKRLGEICGLAR